MTEDAMKMANEIDDAAGGRLPQAGPPPLIFLRG
jgi:hypothetical protein